MTRPIAPIGVDASRSFGTGRTGTEHYATEITRHLIRLAPGRFRLYFRTPPQEQPPSGADLRVLSAPRLWTHLRLGPEVALRPPSALFIPAHVMPLVCRPPAVVTVHDLGFEHFPKAHPVVSRAYLRWSTRRHARRAAILVADSTATKEDLVRLYGVQPDRVRVVLLAADDALSPPTADAIAQVRRLLGLAPDAPYLLHVGTLQPRKNLARLLAAYATLMGDHPELRLVLAGGKGWGDEDLAGVARALGVSERVLLPGYVPPPLLSALYGGAAALAMPSLYEGFGLPVVEAMACGAPVLCSNSSSLPEAAGGAALLVDPLSVPDIAAGLRQLLEDDALGAFLRERGLARAALLSWEASARQVFEALTEVADGR